MKKNFLSVIIILLFVISVFSLTACDNMQNEQQSQTEHSHTYSEWQIVTPPTCLEKGERKKTCSCGESVSEEIAPTGHTFSEEWTVDQESDCKEKGTKSRHCLLCNEKGDVTALPKKAHTYDKNNVCTGCARVKNEGTEGYTFLYDGESDGYAITKYNGTSAKISIPEWYDDGIRGEKSITIIGEEAFRYNNNITELIISDGIITLERHAFGDCENLATVFFGKDVKNIDFLTFEAECGNKLESLVVDKDNPYLHSVENCVIDTEKRELILGCKNSVIPSDGSVTAIGSMAFCNCPFITVTIPDTIQTIGMGAFYFCRSLLSVTIGKNVTEIGEMAFGDCHVLFEVYNKSSLNINKGSEENGHIGYVAKEIYTSEYRSKIINENGYLIYSGETEKILCGYIGTGIDLVLPSTITKIGGVVCIKNENIKSVIIPSGVTEIGRDAFGDCEILSWVYIPDTVNVLSDFAFTTGSLQKIYYQGTESTWNNLKNEYNDSYHKLCSGTCYYYSESDPVAEGNYWHYDTDGKTIIEW